MDLHYKVSLSRMAHKIYTLAIISSIYRLKIKRKTQYNLDDEFVV